jgi:hypothetical protein
MYINICYNLVSPNRTKKTHFLENNFKEILQKYFFTREYVLKRY